MSMVEHTTRKQEVGYIGRIPIRNLWLLMLYSSNLIRMSDEKTLTGIEEMPEDIPDLIARILCRQIEERIRRNLSYNYEEQHKVLSRVRGRINFLKTKQQGLWERGKIACSFNALTIDTPRNRYIRSALLNIFPIVQCKSLAHQCKALASSLWHMGVKGICPSRQDTSIDLYGRHDFYDKPMVEAAHLAFDLALPTEDVGDKLINTPNRERMWVQKLFEKGIAGFYDYTLHSKGWDVASGRHFDWGITQKTSGIDTIFPSMITDIVLTNKQAERCIVIDTKFQSIITHGRFRDNILRNSNIYQIYTYLRTQEGQGKPFAETATGVLLHPAIDENVDERIMLQNHEIRFMTVDLADSPKNIKNRLLEIIH